MIIYKFFHNKQYFKLWFLKVFKRQDFKKLFHVALE